MPTLQHYLEHLGALLAEFRGEAATPITGAASDSRRVAAGNLFVAIPGAKDDGSRYIPEAIRAGAVAVAAREWPEKLPPGMSFLRVTQPYLAAGRIAEMAAMFPARQLRLLGVTGTKGKTTVAFLLRDMLRRAGRTAGMVGTVVYDTGDGHPLAAERTTPTPFDLQDLLARMVTNRVQDAVLEISSHALDQRRAGTARFAGGIFTNLSGDHLDYHHDMDAYFAAKALLFTEYLAPGGTAVVNVDNDWGRRLAAALRAAALPLRLLEFGQAARQGVHLQIVESSVSGSRLRLTVAPELALSGCQSVELQSPLMGVFNIYNIGQAATLALAMGLPVAAVSEAVCAFAGAPGRLQSVTANNGVVAFVDYAHTDDALRNVLETLRGLKAKRLLVLFGCGGERDRTKRPRMGKVAAELADILYLTSDNPRGEDPEQILADIRGGVPPLTRAFTIPDRREAIRRLVTDACVGDVLLLAGKGHEDYQERNGEKKPFDDMMEVRAALRERGWL